MPYGPGGVFSAISLPGSFNPAISGSEATPDAWNALLADLTGGLTQAITKNGLTTPTANLPMGTYRHTGVGAAVALTDYARYDQVVASAFSFGTAGGTGDAITLAFTPAVSAYAVGRAYRAIAPGTNTGPVTINIDGIGAGSLRWADGTQLAPGDLPSGAGFTFMVVDITTPTAPIFHLQTVATPHTGSAGPDLASAGTVSIGASVGTYQNITGTTTITSFGAGRLGTERQVTFTGILTLTHNGTSLILPGGANITTAPGDTARLVSLGGSNWKCEVYTRQSYAPGGEQIAFVQSAAMATGTTAIPLDNTIPQNTEGDQYLSLAITPRSATSTLVIDVLINLSSSAQDNPVVALFQSGTASALGAWIAQVSDANASDVVSVRYIMTSGTTSSTTFTVRVGSTAGATITVNGFGGAAKLGGVLWSGITIREVA